MSIKAENITNGKIVGIGDVTILPGETKEVPEAYEASPILEIYVKSKTLKLSGKPSAKQKTEEEVKAETEEEQKKAAESAEELRKARLASLNGISEEDLGKLAIELGINLADCKDQADVLKKVKAALKK